jgi:hypothetical protein
MPICAPGSSLTVSSADLLHEGQELEFQVRLHSLSGYSEFSISNQQCCLLLSEFVANEAFRFLTADKE